MKRFSFCIAATALFLASSAHAASVTYRGITFPGGDASFADAVVADSVNLGQGTTIPSGAPNGNPAEALGMPSANQAAYTLGVGGSIVLQFTDNSLTGSGDSAFDLHIFEVGPDVEDTFVSISVDGNSFLDVGKVFGSTSSIDIDRYFTGTSFDATTKFSYVKLVDDPSEGDRNPNRNYAGADIDTVGAISSAPPVPAVPLPASSLLMIGGILGLTSLTRRKKAHAQ